MTGRTLEGVRAAYGLVQLGRPGVLPKLLGARLLLQAGVTLLATPAPAIAEPTSVTIVGDSVTHGLSGEYSCRHFAW